MSTPSPPPPPPARPPARPHHYPIDFINECSSTILIAMVIKHFRRSFSSTKISSTVFINHFRKHVTSNIFVNHVCATTIPFSRRSYQEMLSKRSRLPAFEMRRHIIDTVRRSQVVVISGETGCGKTTQVPFRAFDSVVFFLKEL